MYKKLRSTGNSGVHDLPGAINKSRKCWKIKQHNGHSQIVCGKGEDWKCLTISQFHYLWQLHYHANIQLHNCLVHMLPHKIEVVTPWWCDKMRLQHNDWNADLTAAATLTAETVETCNATTLYTLYTWIVRCCSMLHEHQQCEQQPEQRSVASNHSIAQQLRYKFTNGNGNLP